MKNQNRDDESHRQVNVEGFSHPNPPRLTTQLVAEFGGSLWVTLLGCGLTVFSAQTLAIGAGPVTESLTFGLAVATASYAMPAHSGAYFNPAISVGLAFARRIAPLTAIAFTIFQVLGALGGAGLVALIAKGRPEFELATSGLSASGYAEHSPSGYALLSAAIVEFIGGAFLTQSALRTKREARGSLSNGTSACAVGLLVSLVTGGYSNPACRSGPALLVRGWALHQLWLFWAAPLAGATLVALIRRIVKPESDTRCNELLNQNSSNHALVSRKTAP